MIASQLIDSARFFHNTSADERTSTGNVLKDMINRIFLHAHEQSIFVKV